MGRSRLNKSDRREESFARQYVILRSNGLAAAIAAGFPRASAHVRAAELVKKRKVRERIAALFAEAEKKDDFSAQKVLHQLAKIAFSDVRALFDSDNKLKPIEEWPADVSAAVQAVETNSKGNLRGVKLVNQVRALEIFCRYYKMFAEDRTPADLGVKVIVLDMPRPIRNVTPQPALPENGSQGQDND